jgi:hypothetical protein
MSVSSIDHIKSWKDIKDHIISYAGELDYLDQYEDLDGFLGSGAYGKVWKIKGKELTLKVTTNQDEAKISSKLEKINADGFLKIYKTININSDPSTQIRIQEMCYENDLREADWLATSYVHSLIYKKLEKGDEYGNDHSGIVRLRKDLKRQAGGRFDMSLEILQNLYDMLMNVYFDLKKIGYPLSEFEYVDVHGANVMKNKAGKFVLVDF